MRIHKNNKRYDTDTAQLIGTADNLQLFRKKTGEFFLYDGLDVTPIDYEKAKVFVADRLPQEYNKTFGNNEDSDKTTITLYLKKSTVQKLKQAAAQQGLSMSAYIESII